MTLKSQMVADVSSVLLNTDEMAESITLYADGDVSGIGTPVVGVFDETEPQRTIERGRDVIRRGSLGLADSVSVTTKAAWLIRGEVWQTMTSPASIEGLRTLQLQRNDIEERGRNTGGLK